MTSIAPKHTLLELNRRVDDLARKSPTLDTNVAQQIAQELGVPLAEVSARFAAQLKVIEGAGDRSKTLRDNNQGGSFAGQAKVTLSSSPALKGTNLKAPGDDARAIAKQWQPVLDKVQYVNDRIREGRLSSPAADLELQALNQTAPDPGALWTKDGAATRAKLDAAFDELARLLPKAVVAVVPGSGVERHADESALANHINEALFTNDQKAVHAFATQYLEKFPNEAMAPWAKNLLADG